MNIVEQFTFLVKLKLNSKSKTSVFSRFFTHNMKKKLFCFNLMMMAYIT